MKDANTEMPFVLDASIAACWAFGDENNSDADMAFSLMSADEAIVPAVWWFELRNVLIVNERRKRITESDSGRFLMDISTLRIRTDRTPDETNVLRLARHHKLSVYDAAYLEVAIRYGLELATLDEALARAARAQQIRLVKGKALKS